MTKPVISSIRIYVPGGQHAHIDVWSRGGIAGSLTVRVEDACEVVDRLARNHTTPTSPESERAVVSVEGSMMLVPMLTTCIIGCGYEVRGADQEPWDNRIEDDDRSAR